MTDVVGVPQDVYDHIEMCEKQLDAYIDRRISSSSASGADTDKDVEDLWLASSRKFDRNRRIERLFEWKAYHRVMAYAARRGGEINARSHDEQVEKIEAEIVRVSTGRLDDA
jgi:hypothetical protein